MPAATPLHAVCITGQERSFGEIGANVREGVLRMLGTPRVAFFGVKPVNDPWTGLQKLLPLTTVIAQHKCWDAEDLSVTVRWVHCDMRGRSDCRVSFIQTMCDLKACLRMVSSFESHNGMQFATITKLRPDVFWETAFDLPEVQANTVYVPGIDAAGGVNDKLAVGGREAMRSYLSRYKYVKNATAMAASVNIRLQSGSTEMFLAAALRTEQVQVRREIAWVHCMHNRKMLLMNFGRRGCIARVRCRTPCESLLVPGPGIKAGSATCHNVTCAAMRRADTVGSIPMKKNGDSGFGTWVVDQSRTASFWRRSSDPNTCVDVGGGKQLFHPCDDPQRKGRLSFCGQACEWPRDAATGAYQQFATLDALPDCILPTLRSTTEPVPAECIVSHRTLFTNDTLGTWPIACPVRKRSLSKAEAGRRLAVGGISCPSSRVYRPSEWEAAWRERVGEVVDNSVSWAASCRRLREDSANVWHWLQLAQARSNGTVGLSASWDAAVVSHHRVISCDGTLLARVPLEPLVSFLRHPLAVCWTKVSHLLAKEHLLVPWANEIFPRAARSFFFDVGASLYASGRTKGGYSQSWFAKQYSTRGLAFDRVVAWEAANSTDQTILSQLPPAVRSATTIHREPPTLEQLLDSGSDSLTYHNFAVDAGPDSARNPLRVLEALTRPEDFVVLKIDIDAPSVERELVGQLLKQPTLQQRVDEFFWEHEVMGSPMVHRGWTIRKTDRGRPKETLANSYDQFRALREAGIRAHSWV